MADEEKKPPPVVLVVWEDAKTVDSGTWVDNKDIDYKPQIFYQVGFLVKRDRKGVILSPAWSPDLVAPRDQIPRGMIRSITYLVPEEKKRRR